jgi:hypothetical protein|tara:strand:- start:1136 stop:1414 length:279 start_codon:yes stop_codon:yes gene_type:complete
MVMASVKKVKSVTRYEPGPLPEKNEDLGVYVVTELTRLGNILLNQSLMRLEQTNTAPDKPRDGDIRYGDGTNWDPGSGAGIYWYDGSSWTQL